MAVNEVVIAGAAFTVSVELDDGYVPPVPWDASPICTVTGPLAGLLAVTVQVVDIVVHPLEAVTPDGSVQVYVNAPVPPVAATVYW